ncbi:cation:proton antiporter subunit C [Microbulbifer sp. YPW1]|uniref:cation:proton antiporter subunit C n=1 Tax=unclassified Microbulbifer TaxID=2619833 RepID=UPI00159B5158|nr:cation:proton antiporter subunit C [Microbulbifer sp. YPW1]QKX17245.1 cation:proton antiporter subunit C [Microbulbifer sp. YPW1]
MLLASHYNYWIVIALMMIGLYMVIAQGNLVKKVIGLNIFQTSVFIFYISVGKVEGGSAPILSEGEVLYSNPLPHVLILTAIVVGIATTALALALVIRIKRAYGSIEERDIQSAEEKQEQLLRQSTVEGAE